MASSQSLKKGITTTLWLDDQTLEKMDLLKNEFRASSRAEVVRRAVDFLAATIELKDKRLLDDANRFGYLPVP